MADQATLVLIKPDAIRRQLTGHILTRLAETRLELIGAKVVRVNQSLAEEHYKHLCHQPFYRELLDYIQGKLHGVAAVLALVYWGPEAIQRVRQAAGATNPEQADPASLRGMYGRITTNGVMENLLHASSDEAEAEREVKLWFRPEELLIEPYGAHVMKSSSCEQRVWT